MGGALPVPERVWPLPKDKWGTLNRSKGTGVEEGRQGRRLCKSSGEKLRRLRPGNNSGDGDKWFKFWIYLEDEFETVTNILKP